MREGVESRTFAFSKSDGVQAVTSGHFQRQGGWGLAILWVICSFFSFAAHSEGLNPATTAATPPIDRVVQALCSEHVVLLGEPAHGFADTSTFKVQMVRRLVEECHFNAVAFEAGAYDFIHIERVHSASQIVTEPMISAAIGGIWANKETRALVPFLAEKVNAGTLMLGGLDDQLGSGTWASREMSSDLTQPLRAEEKARCTSIFEKHLRWQYTDAAPYGPPDKQRIETCLDEIRGKLASSKERQESVAQSRMMVESLQRYFARNFTEDDFSKKDQFIKGWNDRDLSMSINYKWFRGHLPAKSKIIVWAATAHTAKDLSDIAGFEGRVPLGFYIHQQENGRAFSLGFSAYAGEWAFVHQPVTTLSKAPAASIEAQVFSQSDQNTVYLSPPQLQQYGQSPARALGEVFYIGNWDHIIDGLVMFRQEHAPTWIPRSAQ